MVCTGWQKRSYYQYQNASRLSIKHTILFVPLQVLPTVLKWTKWVSPAHSLCDTDQLPKSSELGLLHGMEQEPSFLRDKSQLHSQTRAHHGPSLLCSPVHYRHPPGIRNFRKPSCKYLGHHGIMEVEPYERSSFPAVFRNSLNLQIQLHQLKHSLSTVVSVPMDCLSKAPLSIQLLQSPCSHSQENPSVKDTSFPT